VPEKGAQPIGAAYDRESSFVAHVRARARHLGWLVYGVPDSRHAHASGFPDLVLVHRERRLVAFVECKSDIGRYTAEQAEWIDALVDVGAVVDIWRPKDHERINRYLEGGAGD
jgi:hypothetical protein